jgi:hypothetical protein
MGVIEFGGDAMTLEGKILNGRVELDAPADWPDGTRVTVEVAAPDEVFEYPHPLAPYDREKEIALLRERYAEVQAGVPGMTPEEAWASIVRECNLPPVPPE